MPRFLLPSLVSFCLSFCLAPAQAQQETADADLTPASSADALSGGHPNVVVILLDTLRPDHLGFYGYEKNTSPFLDELSQSFAVFDRAYSTSTWTAPAVASLFTGHYPPAHGILEGFMAHGRREDKGEDKGPQFTWKGRLKGDPGVGFTKPAEAKEGETVRINRFADDMKLMPEYFKAAGYRTYGITTNPNIGKEVGFDRGFDRFKNLDDADASQVLGKLKEWQKEIRSGDDPSFLYLHFMDVHRPYNPRSPWYEKQEEENADNLARYDSELSFLDQHLKQLFEDWQWGADTLVVFASDHGEEFMDHGQTGHKFSMYRELNHMLLMFRGPGVTAKRTTLAAGIHDVMPTLFDLAGLAAADEGTGVSLKPLLQAEELTGKEFLTARDRIIFAHRTKFRPRQSHIWGANRGKWRFIQKAGKWELYDIEGDPGEKINVLSRYPGIHSELRNALKKFRQRGFGNRATRVEVELDADGVSFLDALGYTGDSGPPTND
jgi:arylsulfatase A-like enzyme